MSLAYVKPKQVHVLAILARLRDTDGQGPLVTITQIMQIFQNIDQSANHHFVILVEADTFSDMHVGLSRHSGIRNLRNYFDDFPGFFRWLTKKPYIPNVYKPCRVSQKVSCAHNGVFGKEGDAVEDVNEGEDADTDDAMLAHGRWLVTREVDAKLTASSLLE